MSKRKILLVEDDDVLRTLTKDSLESNGYEVYEARDGEEGISCVIKIRPDLIITDVIMPRMNGSEFIKHVRALDLGGKIPFIILTVRKLMKDYFETLEIDDFIAKPYETKSLVDKIEQVFQKHDALEKQILASKASLKATADKPPTASKSPSNDVAFKLCFFCKKEVAQDAEHCPACGKKRFIAP